MKRSRMNLVVGGFVIVALAATMTACGADDKTDASGASADAVHTVAHARGTTDVPADPQRVVVLEPVQLDTSVALGVTPVGTAVLSEATGVPAYLGAEAAQIETVGTVTAPNFEKIAALRPDLIIGTQTRHGDLYERLSSLAPTVFMATQTDPWQDNVRFVADALGKSDQADVVLGDYNARCKEIATERGTGNKTAQLIRPRDDVLTLYGPTSFAGSTLECAGLTIPARDWENSISVDLSPEFVSGANADIIMVTSVNPNDPTTLPSTIADNVGFFPNPHLVDMSYWITGVGPLGGLAVLDDIERILETNG
ncbi:ABC transporter substrate-binding protein [Rhodococcus sp. ARC_M6]|uniref:ABC transporter substrate-binding protein n=1 Tax=Rhodococcus sp. ARC_M6 TaxID=2928852 RepID=UPI001FB3002F|nr:iron-siderophore ABC transporter substrate-binding protein [Rhodococcus sp. ARC_M6]MCJ0902970.1 iron-siderophore ABC transporter substrate-binding protein [Rhodococcus sp. ARC_M6]